MIVLKKLALDHAWAVLTFLRTVDFDSLYFYVRTGLVFDFFINLVLDRIDFILNFLNIQYNPVLKILDFH